MRFQAILFDLDGTLIDSLADLGQAMNHALVLHGRRPHPLSAYRQMVGDGVRELVARAAPEATAEERESLLSSYRSFYADNLTATTRPFPGLEAVLEACVARGQRLAVLSNKSHAFTQALVQRLLPEVPFTAVWGEREAFPRKPDPAAALALSRALEVDPAACAFVGDTPVDLRTAAAAGMCGVGVTWGFRSRDELADPTLSAHALVETAPELAALLES